MPEHSHSSSEASLPHYFQTYAEKILKQYHAKLAESTPDKEGDIPFPPKWSKQNKPESLTQTQPIKRIAIVGAGVAGLHAATILGKYFKVDIYEASKRIGGRLYTHKFENDSAIGTREPGGEYDYFDVGAMRFPETDVMKRTFDLFDDLRIPLIPYCIYGKKTWRAFNEKRYRREKDLDWSTDPFGVGVSKGGNVPDEYATQSPYDLLNVHVKEYLDELVRDRDSGFGKLFKQDCHSTRSYLKERSYPQSVIDYIETMCYATGDFDRAFAEIVIDELCFRYNQKDADCLKWKCVEGGTRLIPLKMVERLQGADYCENVSIYTGHQVTAVDFKEVSTEGCPGLAISGLRSASAPGGRASFNEVYSHVVLAIPPPCLRTIDLSSCRLDYAQRNALRQVSVCPSIKIGVKFKTAWWNQLGIRGGQSSTDRMARAIVYPSHGDGKSTVLIASYAWGQDTVALSSLIQGRGSPEEERLKELMLADIAYIHKDDKINKDQNITIEYLREQFQDMFPWDWTHHPYSMGAFGMFGPSQYSEFYCALTRPAAERTLHFIGETISTTRWVAGALESAERGAYQILKLHKIATSEEDESHNALKDFKSERKPELGVNKNLLKLQLCVSAELQAKEFHPPEKRGGYETKSF